MIPTMVCTALSAHVAVFTRRCVAHAHIYMYFRTHSPIEELEIEMGLYIRRLDVDGNGSTGFRKPKAWGCSVPSKAGHY